MKCISKGFKSYYESDDKKYKSIKKEDIIKYELGFTLNEAIKVTAEWKNIVKLPDCFSKWEDDQIIVYKIETQEDYDYFSKAVKANECLLTGTNVVVSPYKENIKYYYIKTFKDESFNYTWEKQILPLDKYLQELVFAYNNISNEIDSIQTLLDIKVPKDCNM